MKFKNYLKETQKLSEIKVNKRTIKEDLDDWDDKIIALAQHLELDEASFDEITHGKDEPYVGGIYYYGDEEYLVLTDDEADRELSDSHENFIEEVVFQNLPKEYQIYFDKQAFKDDYTDRGEYISGYDGIENEETVNGTTYYIYRRN